MRTDTAAFAAENSQQSKDPRYVIELAFDSANTDLHYFTTHSDAALPTGASATLGVVEDLSGSSQKINPDEARNEIGNTDFSLVDKANAVRDLLSAKLAFGASTRHMRVRTYVGYKDLAWSDYTLAGTQIISSIQHSKGSYKFQCDDIQRAMRTKIFIRAKTALSQSIDDTQTLIPVISADGFTAVQHGSSYSDAPNSTVLYIKVDDEIIRCTGTTTDPTLGLCFVVDTANQNGRGALNTRAAAHSVDPNATNDNKKKVEEYIYLELPAVKLAYALLTGVLYGQGGATLPTNWHMGIDTSWVQLSDFTGIGDDLWDTANDDNGFVAYFDGLDKTDGKKFIEQELMFLIGCFMPVRNDGSLGLRRFANVTREAAWARELTTDNIYSYSDMSHDFNSILNNIEIDWNWDDATQQFTRRDILQDLTSQAIYGVTPRRTISFRGLHGSRHTIKILQEHFNAIRDRYSGEPLRMNLVLLPSQNDIEVGDIVRVTLPQAQDYVTGGTLDRSFEVQHVAIDWMTGRVSVDLFASSRAADPINNTTATFALPDSFYSSAGTELQTYLDANYPGAFSVTGGVGHITANCTLPGNANAGNAIYYFAGDLQIDSGVTVSISENVQLRPMGHLQINGKIDGKGTGIASGGGAGFIGKTEAGGSVYLAEYSSGHGIYGYADSQRSNVISAENNTAPYIILNNDGTNLIGLPTDLRGTAGSQGGAVTTSGTAGPFPGGAGGAGGAGLLIIARGMNFGASGSIDVSGNDGSQASVANADGGYRYIYPGTGGGGHPGAVYFMMDGSAVSTPVLTKVIAKQGYTRSQGTPLPVPGKFDDLNQIYYGYNPAYSYYTGINDGDRNAACVRLQFVPENQAAQADPNTGAIAAPTGLSVTSGTSDLLLQQDGTIVVRAHLTWTPSVDQRVVGYRVQYKQSTDTSWYGGPDVLGQSIGDAYVIGLKSGVSYDFRVAAADGYRDISTWLTVTGHIVSGKSAPPSDVPVFNVYQNGGSAVMRWTGVSDADLLGYEIRYGPQNATTWADATPLTRATRGTNITTADVPDGDWTFLIKAVDTSGNFSVNALSSNITFASDYTVIFQRQQAPDWLGTLSGFVRHWTGKLLIDDQYLASHYTNFEEFDNYVATPVAVSEYTSSEFDILFDDDCRCWGDIISGLGPDITAGVADPQLQIDYHTAAGAYNGYENWSVGIVTFRYMKFRIYQESANGLVVISAFKPTIDRIEYTQRGKNITVSSTGTPIVFAREYHVTPHINITVLSNTAVYAAIDPNISTTGFTVHIFDTNGNEVGGNINWEAIGV